MASRGSGRRAEQAAQEPQEERRNLPARVDPKVTIQEVRDSLEAREATLVAYLSRQDVSPERFVSTALQAIAQNPKLGLSTRESLVYSILEAAQLGLEPTGILGGAWLVPYWSGKKSAYEAKLIVGYRGYIDLFRRSGEVETIEARVVYKGDEFAASFGIPQELRHVPYFLRGEESGERVAVYWKAVMRGGTPQFDVLPISQIEQARKSSRAADGGPWTDWYDEMAKKTAIRRAVATLPVSVFQARRAVQLENEAEEAAVVEPMPRGGGKKSARDRAVDLLEGGSDESSAGEDAAAAEQAPEGETPDTSSDGSEGRSGRPTASAEGSSSAEARLKVELEPGPDADHPIQGVVMDGDEGLEAADAAWEEKLGGSKKEGDASDLGL